ncbi:MAG: hypothetical protein AAB481_04725 [Patescibacteria group bacterium]
MKFQKNVAILLCLISCVLLLVFLWWHYKLGMIRYFDVDEYAHLSWAYQMLSGRRPYVDFLFYIPPGFQVFLMPLFAFGIGVTPILAGRLVQFVLFVLLVGVTMLLFWMMRRSWVAILAGAFLAFLPLPFDKFLEIRPDTLATLLAMAGMVFQVLALKGVTLRGRVTPYQVLSGLFYGLSLLILPKTLPQVGVAVGIGVMREIWGDKGKQSLFHLIAGLALPISLFALFAISLGNIDQVIYSLTKLPVEALKISQTFIMMPDLFFYPNSIFYGASGWVSGLLVNHAIWILAIVVGAYRLVAPFLSVTPAHAGVQSKTKNTKDWIPAFAGMTKIEQGMTKIEQGMTKIEQGMTKKEVAAAEPVSQAWSEFLIAATFFVHIVFYVLIAPLKHTQYLIPIAVFVAFYAADAVDMVWQKISVSLRAKRSEAKPSTGLYLAKQSLKIASSLGDSLLAMTAKGIALMIPVVFLMSFVWLYQVFVAVNTPKLAWTNADTLSDLTILYQTIPKSEYILDLTGQTIYYRHPFVACCIHFGQSAPYLSRPLPSLSHALEKTNTKYIFEGGLKRTNTLLPADQAYIAAHYLPHPTIGGLLVNKK